MQQHNSVCALEVALTHSPPLSEIFVFTDASPKDAQLYDAVKALALEKQSKVGLVSSVAESSNSLFSSVIKNLFYYKII